MAKYIGGNAIRPGYIIVYNKELYRVMTAEHRTPRQQTRILPGQTAQPEQRHPDGSEIPFR